MQHGAESLEDKVVIQDIVCAAIPEEKDNPVGEFGVANADEATRLDRMYDSIEKLIKIAADEHNSKNCDANHRLKPDNANNIVRLITNEFVFYTKTPLSLDEFTKLQQRIADFAAKQPENLHVVLGSFAVRTKDNLVMNVVPYIECGPQPKINFIVKNFPSEADPVYKEKINNRQVTFPNVEINATPEMIAANKSKDKLNVKPIVIQGKECPFSFNNIQIRKTAGNVGYVSCVDICYDHHFATAKNYLTRMLTQAVASVEKGSAKVKETLPPLCSHIVVSNSNPVYPSKKLAEVVTHVDPKYSHDECKPTTDKTSQKVTLSFGTALNVITTSPLACTMLLQDSHRELVKAHNEKVLSTPAPPTSSFRTSLSLGTKRLSALFSKSPQRSRSNSDQPSGLSRASLTETQEAKSELPQQHAQLQSYAELKEEGELSHRKSFLPGKELSDEKHKEKSVSTEIQPLASSKPRKAL